MMPTGWCPQKRPGQRALIHGDRARSSDVILIGAEISIPADRMPGAEPTSMRQPDLPTVIRVINARAGNSRRRAQDNNFAESVEFPYEEIGSQLKHHEIANKRRKKTTAALGGG